MSDTFFWTDALVAEYSLASQKMTLFEFKRFITERESKQNSNNDWEIVAYCDQLNNNKIHSAKELEYFKHNYNIYSARRLSDGEVFVLHETRVVDPNTNHSWIISEITIGKDGRLFFNGVNITHVQKAKQPLFTTVDGKEIYKGDKYVAVQKSTFDILTDCIYELDYPDLWWTFSTEQAAKEYVIMNKPVLSFKDIEDVATKVEDNLKADNFDNLLKQYRNGVSVLFMKLKQLVQQKIENK